MRKRRGQLKIINSIKYYFSRCDSFFWIISAVISVYCLLLLKSVSRDSDYDFFKIQLIAIIVGYIGAIILSDIDYRLIAKYWYIPAGLCFILIILTLFIGVAVEGSGGVSARAWLRLPGNISFQPSELAKIGFIITFANHLQYLKQKMLIHSFLHISLLGIHAIIPIALTHIQGDDGAAIIFFCIFLVMSFSAGVQLRYFIGLFLVMLAAIPFIWKYFLASYQKRRIINQLMPESDPLGDGFQQIQGKISIGSGKIFGHGLFHGPRVGRYGTVPVQESDFIFSAAGEELGFLGCMLIMILLAALLFRAIYTAYKSSDNLGTYICFGFFGMIFSQAFFNLGMCLGLLPVMGVTLPFFSAGGSSAACLYLGLGLVQNVFIRKDDRDLESDFLFIKTTSISNDDLSLFSHSSDFKKINSKKRRKHHENTFWKKH